MLQTVDFKITSYLMLEMIITNVAGWSFSAFSHSFSLSTVDNIVNITPNVNIHEILLYVTAYKNCSLYLTSH